MNKTETPSPVLSTRPTSSATVEASNWRTILRLLALARPHWQWLSVGILLSVITVLANIALLSVSGWFIAAMAAAGIAGVSINYFTPSGVIRFLAIVRTAGRYGERLVTHNATFLMLAHLRHWFYQKLEPLAPAGLHQYRSSDLLSRLQADIEQLDDFYLRIALPVIVALITVPIVYAVANYFYPPLAFTLLIALISSGVLLPLWVAKRSQKSGSMISTEQQQLSTAIIDGLQGMRELEIYGASAAQKAHVLRCSQQLSDTQTQLNNVNANAQSVSLTIINICIWCSLLLLSNAVINSEIKNGELIMLLLLVIAAFETVLPLPLAFEQLSSTLAAAKRLFQLADQPPVRAEPLKPRSIDLLSSKQQLNISIKQLSFSYPNTDQHNVINNFSMNIQQGEKVALTGKSGSGKSSIVQLLQGFYPCDGGMISIGSLSESIDINDCSGDALRAQISLVSQSCYLFAATIKDNLLLANPKATDEQLAQACSIASCDFIADLPQGIDTWLGETGKGLSGGQARRIHIAQAILKNSPILILDEPTEGLDPITEQAVMAAIWQLMADKTVILITHNPRLLRSVDRVYSL
ncbi:MAG: ATP-binding cassette subfamily C protein CydC [Oceanospirillaceae bacterium]|jgi:ATP-binding cassette subfamily C protein CydC